MASTRWDKIPKEMKALNQWCISGKNKEPQLINNNTGTLYKASPVQGPWLSFNDAAQFATEHDLHIGFILTAADPFVCVDLDIKDVASRDKCGHPLPIEKLTKFNELRSYEGYVDLIDSYTELSKSGQGAHIWAKANIGAGRRSGGVEVYSQERFIVCTGKPVTKLEYFNFFGHVYAKTFSGNKKLIEAQRQIELIVAQFTETGKRIELTEIDPVFEDGEIWRRAREASNADKFVMLCSGNWKDVTKPNSDLPQYPSQSEADYSLMSMFAFYTESNSQCRRMFRETVLGARDKANRNDYHINMMLKGIRARQADEKSRLNIEALQAALTQQAIREEVKRDAINKSMVEMNENVNVQEREELKVNNTFTAFNHYITNQKFPNINKAALKATLKQPIVPTKSPDGGVLYPYDGYTHRDGYEKPTLSWPPGIIGDVAKYIYRYAVKPIREVAITAALGFFAGMTGQAFNIAGSGLNLYILLVAKSGIGKESLHKGIANILNQCELGLSTFVDSSEFVSGAALEKAFVDNHTSFVNLNAEIGSKIRVMAEESKGPNATLRTTITKLYHQSGLDGGVAGRKHASKDNSSEGVSSFAYSLVGESTPKNLYGSITTSMLEDGFLSRFSIIEYEGDRVPTNMNPVVELDENLKASINAVGVTALIANSENRVTQVPMDTYAHNVLLDYDAKSDAHVMLESENDSFRQIHNRRHIKAMKIAAILAVADDPVVPEINKEHVDWAVTLVDIEVDRMIRKIKEGEIGQGDENRDSMVLAMCKTFLKGGIAASYKVHPGMIQDGIIPRRYLSVKCSSNNCFSSHPQGSGNAFKGSLIRLMENGYISEVPKKDIPTLYGSTGSCYRLLITV